MTEHGIYPNRAPNNTVGDPRDAAIEAFRAEVAELRASHISIRDIHSRRMDKLGIKIIAQREYDCAVVERIEAAEARIAALEARIPTETDGYVETLVTPPEPVWVPFGDGWRLKGTNWAVRLGEAAVSWGIWCGVYAGPFGYESADKAKTKALELRRLMAEEPTP